MSLLLFSNKEESPDKHLLEDSQREKTADIVNRALLRMGNCNEGKYFLVLLPREAYVMNRS